MMKLVFKDIDMKFANDKEECSGTNCSGYRGD